MAANGCSRERVICGDGAFIRRLPYKASRSFVTSESKMQSTDSNNGLLLLADIALANNPDIDELDDGVEDLFVQLRVLDVSQENIVLALKQSLPLLCKVCGTKLSGF